MSKRAVMLLFLSAALAAAGWWLYPRTQLQPAATITAPIDSARALPNLPGAAPDTPGSALSVPAPDAANANNALVAGAATTPTPLQQQVTLAQAYSALSAAQALTALAATEPTTATAAIESALERLCFRVTDGSEPPPPPESSTPDAPSFRVQQRQLLDAYCSDIDRTEGTRDDLERALSTIRTDSFDETNRQLRNTTEPKSAVETARELLSSSRDELAMAAAAIFLDEQGALGVPPHSVDREHPARLNDLVADVVGWVRCAELNGCAARAAPVISLCMNSNDCPPAADYAGAMRQRLSETRWEQALWLYAQITSLRANAARANSR